MPSPLVRLVALALSVACLAPAGCGSGGSSTSGTGPAGPAATTTEPSTAGSGGPSGSTVAGVPCEPIEQLKSHYHAHLTLLRDGTSVTLPAFIGINLEQQCIHWLHTHKTDGVIHIESPDTRTFTLGQFFAIWHMPLSRTAAGPLSGNLHVFVDGRPYAGDPANIVLRPHQLITIESGRQVPPPSYRFAPGL